jgi:hypothetical protein
LALSHGYESLDPVAQEAFVNHIHFTKRIGSCWPRNWWISGSVTCAPIGRPLNSASTFTGLRTKSSCVAIVSDQAYPIGPPLGYLTCMSNA